jgi:SARP family transcriptional regulator, regulator of embCAB operon
LAVPVTRVQVCGPLVVRIAGRRVDEAFAAKQLRLLFGYLVLHRDTPKSREELEWAVWGDRPPSAASAALSALLSKLRLALGSQHVAGRTLLRLDLPADATIDIEAAADAVHRAQSAWARGAIDAAYGPSEVAMCIAERPFLPGTDAPWVTQQRNLQGQILVAALEISARCCLAIGGIELTGAERCARRIVEHAPYHERGHALLMDALAEQGNDAEALLIYERARTLLRDELGTFPGADLQARHARLLQRGADVTTPEPSPVSHPG